MYVHFDFEDLHCNVHVYYVSKSDVRILYTQLLFSYLISETTTFVASLFLV